MTAAPPRRPPACGPRRRSRRGRGRGPAASRRSSRRIRPRPRRPTPAGPRPRSAPRTASCRARQDDPPAGETRRIEGGAAAQPDPRTRRSAARAPPGPARMSSRSRPGRSVTPRPRTARACPRSAPTARTAGTWPRRRTRRPPCRSRRRAGAPASMVDRRAGLAEAGPVRLEEPLAGTAQPASRSRPGDVERSAVALDGAAPRAPADVVERAEHRGDVAQRRPMGAPLLERLESARPRSR